MVRRLIVAISPLLALWFSGCHGCEDEGERQFGLVFHDESGPVVVQFAEVHGLGGSGQINLSPTDSLYHLPISLHQDSSTYLLKSMANQVDTLTIGYQRDFMYQDKKCGFRVRFHDFKVGKSTTFENVEVIDKEHQGPSFGFPSDVYEIRIYR